MRDGCILDCMACGKCAGFNILDSYLTVETSHTPREGYGIAADIGTTSVILALVDLSSGRILARHSFLNPQRSYGPDVISRIFAAGNGVLPELRLMITSSVANGIAKLLEARNISPKHIIDMTVAGNTAMTYLMLGLPCESLGVSPFKPAYELADSYDFKGVFGSDLDISCPVRITTWLAAFVGGDITAGLLHVLEDKKNRLLLIDLGTNGEMALYNKGGLIITSTAAGPAFEGGSHDGGASGAIFDLAELLRGGYVDETGLLDENAPAVFTQKEIRDLQLAKSAIRSGLEILLEASGLQYEMLEAVYLAGGIGKAMDINAAIRIGLLPGADNVRAVGNAALGGAVRMLLEQESINRALELKAAACEINLANHPRFNGYFMDYIGF